MGFFDKFRPSTPTVTEGSYHDLPPGDQSDIQNLLSEGTPVATIARSYGIKSQALYVLKQSMQSAPSTPTRVGRPSGDPELERIRGEIERKKLEAEKEKLDDELEYQRERRKLDLELKRLELDEKRAQMYGDDDDDDDDDFDIKEAANDPEAAMWAFFAKVLQKQIAGNPTSNVPVQPDAVEAPRPPPPNMANDQSFDAIKLEMEIRFTPEQLAKASQVPKPLLHAQIKSQFPGITETNLKHIDQVLATYGQ